MRRISDILGSLGSHEEISLAGRRSRAMLLWSSAVGPPLSDMSVPEGFDGETLRVLASHPAVCMELRAGAEALLNRLNAMAGDRLFTKLTVHLSPFSHRKGKQPVDR